MVTVLAGVATTLNCKSVTPDYPADPSGMILLIRCGLAGLQPAGGMLPIWWLHLDVFSSSVAGSRIWWRSMGETSDLIGYCTVCTYLVHLLKLDKVDLDGPWLWSSGQHAHLLLRRSEFKSHWSEHFIFGKLFEKNENKWKNMEWPNLKKIIMIFRY